MRLGDEGISHKEGRDRKRGIPRRSRNPSAELKSSGLSSHLVIQKLARSLSPNNTRHLFRCLQWVVHGLGDWLHSNVKTTKILSLSEINAGNLLEGAILSSSNFSRIMKVDRELSIYCCSFLIKHYHKLHGPPLSTHSVHHTAWPLTIHPQQSFTACGGWHRRQRSHTQRRDLAVDLSK